MCQNSIISEELVNQCIVYWHQVILLCRKTKTYHCHISPSLSSNRRVATAKTMNSRSVWPSLWEWPIPSHFSFAMKTTPNNWCFRKRTTSSSGSGSSPGRCQLHLCLSQRGKTQITMSQSNIEVPSLLNLHMHIDIRSTCTAYTVTIWGIKIQYSVLIQGP